MANEHGLYLLTYCCKVILVLMTFQLDSVAKRAVFANINLWPIY